VRDDLSRRSARDARWHGLVEPLVRATGRADRVLSTPPGALSRQLARQAPAGASPAPHRLAVIDGDPNWSSVYHRLRRLAADPSPWLVLVDDVGWPHAHRDGYRDPEAIPVDERNACRRQGMLPYAEALVAEGGLSPETFNGVFSHGTRNGVVCAIADFLREHPDFRHVFVPGFTPLGVLWRAPLAAGFPAALAADPEGVLGRAGYFAELGAARCDAANELLRRAQTRMLAPRAYDHEPVVPLAPPRRSDDALRDGLRAALTGHPLLAQLLRGVDAILERAAIPYVVVEGTLLGAVRHAGFVPHDDDLDIVVHRDDVPRLHAAMQAAGFQAGVGTHWPELGPTSFLYVDDPLITDAGLWLRTPVVDVFPVTDDSRSPILAAHELADRERRPFCDFAVAEPRTRDDHDHARRLLALGVGAALDPHLLDATSVRRMLAERLLLPQVRERCAALAAGIAAEDGTQTAVHCIERWARGHYPPGN
jgi:hypothetical protein